MLTMANCKDLPELTLNVAEDHNDVFRLLEVIKPNWEKEQVTVKVLGGGYSCTMLRCSHAEESVTVRVRKLLEGLRNPLLERQAVKALSSTGEFPPVLATFQNGFCYEYIPGRVFITYVEKEVDITENQLRLIAQQMANIHSVKVPEFEHSKTEYLDFFKQLLTKSKPWFEGCPPLEEINDEISVVEQLVARAKSPLALSHGDPHSANLVWNEDLNKMTFVDWEMADIRPRGWDVAYFINSVKDFGEWLKLTLITPENMEKKFCEFYILRWNEIRGLPSPTTEDIEHVVLELKYYLPVVHFAMIIYFIRFEDVMRGFGDPKVVWQQKLNTYLEAKEAITGMKKLGPVPN